MSENDMEISAYRLELPTFDGPLDLLLHLIKKNKVDIYDIPIRLVTGQYMDYLAAADQFNVRLGTEFFELAATLLAIKARLLIPHSSTEPEADPREELAQRLQERTQVLALKEKIVEGLAARADLLERSPTVLASTRWSGDFSIMKLVTIWEGLQREDSEESAQIVREEAVSTELVRKSLLAAAQQPLPLLAYLRTLPSRMYRIVAFLVVLEAVKEGILQLVESERGIDVRAADEK